MPEHFYDCHPEDSRAPDPPAGTEIKDVEPCWHCGTPTPRGCRCGDCLDSADYVPPEAIYHCPTCGRWWAWMTGINVTTIKFGAE